MRYVKIYTLLFVLLVIASQSKADCSLPRPSISTSSSVTFCQGGSVTLTSSTGSGYTYQWKKNNVDIFGATNTSYVATQSGSYTVEVTQGICTNISLPMVVTVNPLPNITVSNDTTLCAGDGVTLSASGGTSYSWNNNNETTSAITVFPTYTRTYTVTVTNSFNCADQGHIDVTVIPLPQAFISATGPTTICQGQTVTMNTASGSGYSYQWKKNGSSISGANTNSYTTGAQGNYNVVVTANGCSKASSVISVVVNPVPVVAISHDTTICAEEPIELRVSGGGTYSWSINGLTDSIIGLNPTVTRTYTVTVTSGQGCTAQGSVTVNVIPLPQNWVSLSGSSAICQGQSVNMNAANGTGYTHQWIKDALPIPGANSSTYTANQAGNYSVVISANGCTKASDIVPITVNPVPVVTISNDTAVCSGDTVTLRASGGISYQWSPGGPAAPNFTVAPTSNKTYTCSVTNSYGCTKSASVLVSVTQLPSASIFVNGSTNICVGQSVSFSANTGSGYTYQWIKDGNNITGAINQGYNASQPGSYSVKVTAGTGCSRAAFPVQVTVNPLPIPAISNDTTICSKDTVSVWASGGVSYVWSTGANQAVAQVSPVQTTVYQVTVTDANGCSQKDSVTISTLSLPDATLTLSGSASLCAGQSVTIQAPVTPGCTYQWKDGLSLLNGQVSSSLSTSLAGNFYVIVYQNGCKNYSDTIDVEVHPNPVVTTSNDTLICSGNPVVLTATGGNQYQWSNGQSGASINITPNSTTLYHVTVTNSFGCSKNDQVTVSVIPSPVATINTSSSNNLCDGQMAQLSAVTGGGYAYQWQKNGINIPGENSSSYSANETGNYTVHVSAFGCEKTSAPFQLTVSPNPVTTISHDTTICSETPITLSATGGSNYHWSNGWNGANITVTPTQTTTYSVTITNSYNCSAAEDVTVNLILKPAANISATGSTNLCQGQTVTFNASTGTGYTYEWLKDGNLITGANSSAYTTGDSGLYAALVTQNGCSKLSNPLPVAVNPVPTATISKDTSICSGDTVTISASGGSNYFWNTGASTSSIMVSPFNSKTYSVTVSYGGFCSDIVSSVLTVNPVPNAFVTNSGSLNLCEGQTVVLNSNSGPGFSYSWFQNDSLMSGEDSSQLIVTEAGEYKAKVSNTFGCSRISAPKSVNSFPQPHVTVSNDTAVCSGSSVILKVSGGTSYLWNTWSGDSSYLITPSITKTYSVTATDSYGCEGFDSVKVTVLPLPANVMISISSSSTICEGNSVTLNSANNTASSYQWLRNGLSIPDASLSSYPAREAGDYNVKVTGNNGCSKTSPTLSVTVLGRPAQPSIVKISEDSLRCTVQGTNYKWYRNGLVVATGVQQIKASKSGEYQVLVFENNCASDTSAAFGFYGTGIIKSNTDIAVEIFPNPTQGLFTVVFPGIFRQEIKIRLLNAVGGLIQENILTPSRFTSLNLDINSYPSGIYLLDIQTEKGRWFEKIIRE